MKDSEIRKRLKKAICCLSAVLILSVVSGAVLLNSIGSTNGWGRTEKQEDEIYTKEQIDKFITSVLIIVQNQPLSSDKAGADMVFIASFDSFRQRLTMAALYSQMEINGAALSNIYANSGPGGLVNAVNDGFGLDIEYYACTDTASLGAMIDLLGGITVKVDFSEADYIIKALGEKSVKAGREKLNGSQSMIYAMDDISGEEQMGGLKRRLELVESAVKNMRRTATKEAMLPLLSLVAGSIKTNLDFSALHDMGYEILKAEEMEYRNIWIPADDSWKLDENGQFTIEDFETNKKQLYNGLYKE